jgi:hypothetical protein
MNKRFANLYIIDSDTDGGEGNNHSSSTGSSGDGIMSNQHRCGSLENAVCPRERTPNETPVDLLRVVEESEEPLSGGGSRSSVAWEGNTSKWMR